jgi:NADH-quinone oxidoreductase subunit F
LDLHIVGAEPTDEERAAVDAVLGIPPSGWRGGPRDIARDGHASRGGRDAWAERHLLLPALHAVQDRIGWISRGALNHICRRLSVPPAEAWGVLTFYHLLSPEPRPPIVAHMCDDIACRLKGAEEICRELEAELGPALKAGLKYEGESLGRSKDPPPQDVAWMRSPCLGQCDRAPAALVVKAGPDPAREELTAVAGAADIINACGGRSSLDTSLGTGQPGPISTSFHKRALPI